MKRKKKPKTPEYGFKRVLGDCPYCGGSIFETYTKDLIDNWKPETHELPNCILELRTRIVELESIINHIRNAPVSREY